MTSLRDESVGYNILRDFVYSIAPSPKERGGERGLLETTPISLIVHFFFFISTKKEKAEPKKKNTNDQIARVVPSPREEG